MNQKSFKPGKDMEFNRAVAVGIIFLFACLEFSQGMVEKGESLLGETKDAKQAKEQYDETKSKDPKVGMNRIKKVIEAEEKLAKILVWIMMKSVCLRRGTVVSGACYALSDFGGESIKPDYEWLFKPYSIKEEKTTEWYEKLYNSIAYTVLLEKEDIAPLMLVTKGGAGNKNTQRYHDSSVCIGAEKTFSKASAETGEKLGSSITLDSKESFKDMEGTVGKVLKWIESTCDEDNEDKKPQEDKEDKEEQKG